jgi:hypothetical protein
MTTTEVEVLAAAEATAMEMAMEMVTDMATGIATGTVTETAMGMVLDVVTEMAMAMAMEMATTTMVVEAEVEEGPQPVVAEAEEGEPVVAEAEEVVVGVGAEAAVGAAVVELFFAPSSRIVQVLMRRLSFSGHVAATGSQHSSAMFYSSNSVMCA